MSGKNIYFIQPGYSFGEGGQKPGAYIPYASGAIAAFAWDNTYIKGTFILKDFVFLFEDIDEAAGRLDTPFLCAFSNYVWNFEYNKSFAQKIKSLYPECITVFGGHQIPPDSGLLDSYPYIDFLIHGEGEEPFAELLTALGSQNRFESIPGLSYRSKNGTAVNNPESFSKRSDYPSPYQTGVFDRLLEENDVDFFAIIETNRGCPHNCTYCDWGISKNRIKVFPFSRVEDDIAWISAHKIEYCFAADANFGILDRDLQIADLLIDSKQNTGYPMRFDVTYAKGREDAVFTTAKKLFDAGLFKGPSLSFQTLSPEALENIGRSNMPLESFTSLLARYKEAGIPAYSEMILGLPGETYESFCKGIGTLLKHGQHNYIDIFRCELLVNAPMSQPEYREKHGIKTVFTPSIQHHIKPRQGVINGYSEIVVATDTMSTAMWVKANLFAMLVQSCHHMGLLKFFAVYLFREKNVDYADFYMALVNEFERLPGKCGTIYREMKSIYTSFPQDGRELSYYNPIFGDLTWFPEEGAFLEYAFHLDDFYNELSSFLKGFEIATEIYQDLLLFQKSVIKLPGLNEVKLSLNYNWQEYFADLNAADVPELTRIPNSVVLSDNRNPDNWEDFARENVWFGRRAGRTMFVLKQV